MVRDFAARFAIRARPLGSTPRAPRRFGNGEVFALLFALSFLAARLLPLLQLPYTCPFRAVTGLPCATCGMTHAFVYMAHGRVAPALEASPLGALGAAGCWAFAFLDGARLALGRGWPPLPPALPRVAAIAGIAALLANWAWLVIAHHP